MSLPLPSGSTVMDTGTDTPGAQAPLRIAIMTDETGWHTGRLKKAFRARGKPSSDARCASPFRRT